jgi:CRISPR/Cas system-associated exonuclease Cas4 (RecB family)
MIKEMLAAHAKTTERTFKHDRSKTVGASEIGLCARRTWYLKHDVPQDPDHEDRWGAKKRGDLIEVFWTKALRAWAKETGHRLRYAGQYQRTLIDEENRLSATPDGLVVEDTGACFVVECKSVDPRVKLEKAKEEHLFQVQVQLGLIRSLTNYKPEHAILSYVDASFLDESREFHIPYEGEIFAAAKERARSIMTAESADELRPEGYISGGAECEYCAYRHQCSAMRAGRVPQKENIAPDERTLHTLILLAQRRESAMEQSEALELEARQVAEQIKEILRHYGTRRIDTPQLRIVWSSLKGRPSWDMPGLRAAAEAIGLDLAQFEKVGDPSDRLVIRLTGTRREAAE